MKQDTQSILQGLNPAQREAVQYTSGPSLVIAGAGSGKTRVLTHKVAYLMAEGMRASNILALTFTNKAAREMRERISALVDPREARYLWMGTFHSIFARLLRLHADKLGYNKDYTIYDQTDSKSAIKQVLKQMQLDEKVYKPGIVQNRISEAKNALISPQAYSRQPEIQKRDMNSRMSRMAEVYLNYNNRLRLSNAMDFDDLLYLTNVLFRDYPEVLEECQKRFQFVLVDEYQDTNFAQYLIVKCLVEKSHKICVVGDDAQSIYSFRGANIRNILTFQQAYPEAKLFKLERNYRSTRAIVGAANSVIAHNEGQIHKEVYSENDKGEPLHLVSCYTDREEAQKVADEISRRHRWEHWDYDDIAILYRTNSQSRVLEGALREESIPYRIYGGHSFYQRKEIKDALAYMRLTANAHDDESLKRIINVPARGIGDSTLEKILSAAEAEQCSAWDILLDPKGHNLQVNAGILTRLEKFKNLIKGFQELVESMTAYQLADLILKQSGLQKDAQLAQENNGENRYENLLELLSGIHEMEEQADGPMPLTDFLAQVSLLTDQDESDENPGSKVTLMTIHAAKGLEFRMVCITGLEENIFPNQMSLNTKAEIEEERRLFYVAITRAKELCMLSHAQNRFHNGKTIFSAPSRFLQELDKSYMDQQVPAIRHNDSFHYDFDSERTHWDKTSLSSQSSSPYHTGDRIRHATFGQGIVIRSYNDGIDKLEVDFNGHHRTLITKLAKMEKI